MRANSTRSLWLKKKLKQDLKRIAFADFSLLFFFLTDWLFNVSDTSKGKSKAKDKKHLQKSNESLSRIWPVKFENQELDAKRKQMLSRELRDSSSRAVKNFKFSRQKTKKNTGAGGTHAPIFFHCICWKILLKWVEFSPPPKLAPKIRMRRFCFPNILHSMHFCIIIIINKQVNKL